MKKLIPIHNIVGMGVGVMFAVFFLTILFGCNTTQQTTAYKTLYGLEVATTGAYDGYTAAVIKGAVPTNSVPQVSHAFNDFQAAMHLAVLGVENNTNAIAPANLIVESQSVIDLITTVTGIH